jgi:hypothetical protein
VASLTFRDQLKGKGHLLRWVLDKDVLGPAGTVPPAVAPFFRAANGKYPCVLLAPMAGGTITRFDFPADEAGLWKLIGGRP